MKLAVRLTMFEIKLQNVTLFNITCYSVLCQSAELNQISWVRRAILGKAVPGHTLASSGWEFFGSVQVPCTVVSQSQAKPLCVTITKIHKDVLTQSRSTMLRVGEKEAGEALLSDLRKENKTLRGPSPRSIEPSFQYGSPPPLPCIFLWLYFSLLLILDPSLQQNRA